MVRSPQHLDTDASQWLYCLSPTWHACRTETADYIKLHSNKALELNNRLSNLKKELQLLEQQAAVLEAQQDYSLQVAAQKTLEYGQASFSRVKKSSAPNARFVRSEACTKPSCYACRYACLPITCTSAAYSNPKWRTPWMSTTLLCSWRLLATSCQTCERLSDDTDRILSDVNKYSIKFLSA